jgi:protease-4
MTTEQVDEIGQGRVWTGQRAKKIGLVDELGGLLEAVELAAELAEIIDFKILEFPRSENGIEEFFNNIETAKELSQQKIHQIYLEEIKTKFLNMQGIQALLPIKYELD